MKAGVIRAGVGGWIFEPWRGTFYPEKLPKTQELSYAARQLATIEINGTYYRTQSPATFAKWAKEVPDGFVFSLKAVRYATQRKVLAEAGESVERFVQSGIVELGDRLGPILWQLPNTKAFDPDDLSAFFDHLPAKFEGVSLRHAIEVRHDSFRDPQFVALARKAGVAVVFAEDASYPAIADPTADFIYARLQTGSDDIPTGYAPEMLDLWADRFKTFAEGLVPDGLPVVAPDNPAKKAARDVFVYVIREGKSRAPQAAMALIDRVS